MKYYKTAVTRTSSNIFCSGIDTYNYTKLPYKYENEYFYTYILGDILSASMNGCVVPTSFKMEKIGSAICVTYNVISYDYWELNTLKICLFSDDGENFDILRINGYSSFIEKNIDMINKIIETAKVKK